MWWMPPKHASKTYLQHVGFVKTCLSNQNSRGHLQMSKNTEIKILLKLNQNHPTYEIWDSFRSQFTNSAVNNCSPTL